MDEIVKKVVAAAGITDSQAATAVQTVVAFMKEHLPAPLAAQVDSLLTAEVQAGAVAKLKDLASDDNIKSVANGLGGLFSKQG